MATRVTKVKLGSSQRRSVVACILNVLGATPCRPLTPMIQRTETPGEAGKVLEPPFHFLLGVPGYTPVRLVHDSDMFSTWGEIALAPDHGKPLTRAGLRQRLLRAAKAAGWKSVQAQAEVQTPDLHRYAITDADESLSLEKTAHPQGQNPPTRYSCRIWIASNGEFIVASYRVDGN